MKRYRKILTILLAMTLILALTSCSNTPQTDETADNLSAETQEGAPAGADGEGLVIGFALNGLNSNAAFIDAHALVQARANEKGYMLMTMDTASDPVALTTTLENFISADCDVIIAQVNNVDLVTDLLPRMEEKGIIFGSYDVVIESAAYNLLSDNFELGKIIGREGGKWLNEHFDGQGEVAICAYDTHEAIKLRGDGIEAGFKEVCPDGVIAQRYGNAATPSTGITAGENLLQSNPDVKVVMGINDGGILGVYEAFKGANLNNPENNIALIGCDGSIDGLNAIREGGIYRATVSLNIAEEIADFFDRCCEYALTGEIDESKKVVHFPMTPIYLENIDEA